MHDCCSILDLMREIDLIQLTPRKGIVRGGATAEEMMNKLPTF
jgi:hypothetical protein